ncbi:MULTISPECIES: hypothetical protein [unclassified Herbaspirillum]|nr:MULTISPECIES: hypothetical protein [unclassified Herbaspirillum]MBB5390541.1 hypothetical protein [Herbaspirillum sp. SJZ102]
MKAIAGDHDFRNGKWRKCHAESKLTLAQIAFALKCAQLAVNSCGFFRK